MRISPISPVIYPPYTQPAALGQAHLNALRAAQGATSPLREMPSTPLQSAQDVLDLSRVESLEEPLTGVELPQRILTWTNDILARCLSHVKSHCDGYFKEVPLMVEEMLQDFNLTPLGNSAKYGEVYVTVANNLQQYLYNRYLFLKRSSKAHAIPENKTADKKEWLA